MKITKRQLRRIIREGNQESAMYDRRAREQGYDALGSTKSGRDVPYEEMVQAVNDNIGEAMRHGAFAKSIYDIMFEGGWIE